MTRGGAGAGARAEEQTHSEEHSSNGGSPSGVNGASLTQESGYPAALDSRLGGSAGMSADGGNPAPRMRAASASRRQPAAAVPQPTLTKADAIKRVVLSLAAATEFATVGSLLWTPAAFLVALGVSKYLSDKLQVRARKKIPPPVYEGQPVPQLPDGASRTRFPRATDLMATMADSPVWMPVFMDNWWRVVERITSMNMIATLQEVLDAEAPALLPLQAKWFFLGSSAPKCTNLQAYYRPQDQGLELFEMDFHLESSDLLVLISANLPFIGKLLVVINDFDVKGRLQFWTLPEEQLVLVAFERRPDLHLGMNVKVWRRTLPGTRLLEAVMEKLAYETVRDLMEGRRRTLLPVEVKKQEEERIPVCGDISIRVLGCKNLPREGSCEYQVTARNSKLELVRKSMVKASDSGSPQWVNQCYTLRTGDSVGMFYLDVDEASSGKRVGSAVISAAALEDGRTAFWATGRDGRPLAKRWDPSDRPWTVTLPLEDLDTREAIPSGDVTVELSALRWMYKQPKAPSAKSFSSSGPRSIILRILEAHNVGEPGKPGTRFVQAKYNNSTYETELIPNSPHLVWNKTFVFNENQSRQARSIRLRQISPGAFPGDLGRSFGAAAVLVSEQLKNLLRTTNIPGLAPAADLIAADPTRLSLHGWT